MVKRLKNIKDTIIKYSAAVYAIVREWVNEFKRSVEAYHEKHVVKPALEKARRQIFGTLNSEVAAVISELRWGYLQGKSHSASEKDAINKFVDFTKVCLKEMYDEENKMPVTLTYIFGKVKTENIAKKAQDYAFTKLDNRED